MRPENSQWTMLVKWVRMCGQVFDCKNNSLNMNVTEGSWVRFM